jgi:hypothetical protein
MLAATARSAATVEPRYSGGPAAPTTWSSGPKIRSWTARAAMTTGAKRNGSDPSRSKRPPTRYPAAIPTTIA